MKRCEQCQKNYEADQRARYHARLRELGECVEAGCRTPCAANGVRCEAHRVAHREAMRARRPQPETPVRLMRCGWCRQAGHTVATCERKRQDEAEVAAGRVHLALSRTGE
jgi:hypothetical protein